MHGGKTPDAYLNRTKKYTDALTAIGEPIKDKDLIMLAVSGLREEYNGLKTTITSRQSPTAFSELHALLSNHDYMLGKTCVPAPSFTLSFATNYAVGSQSMPEARQAQLSKLTAQLSALGFQVSPIAPSGPRAFDGVRPSNNRNNNNNNRGNCNNFRGNNNQGHGNGRQFDWASTQNTVANSHVTPDLEAMDNSKAYYGDDALHVSNKSPYVIPTTNHPSPSSPRSLISSPSSVSHLSPTSQTPPESSNAQPSPVSTTSIPTPPPPPITWQRPANLRQNPKQRVPYNPSANHAIVLPTFITEPTSFTVANNSPKWRQAMKEEYVALIKNKTLPRASNTNVVDGKWVYRLRQDKNGTITRYKARFVAKGFRQQPGNNKGTIDNIICQLGSAFALKDLGPLNYFLGIEIVPHVSDILLSQKKYILELLQSAGLVNCNPVSSPMVTSSSLSLDDNIAFSNLVKYLQVVGSLQYVTLSRPDTAFAVNKLNMVCSYVVLLVLPFKLLLTCYEKLTWLQALLNELGIRSSSTPILWCDNLCATYLSANHIFHARIKHVEIDYHFVREKVAQGDLRVQHISTKDQIANIFTKPLPTPRFFFLRSKLQCEQHIQKVTHSIKVGIALVLVSLLYLLDPLFEQVGENAMWAIMTVVVVFEFFAGATLSKGLLRGLGTILGGGLGCLAAIVADNFGKLGNAAVVGVSLFIFGAAATYCRLIPSVKRRYDYGVMIFILTFNLVAVSGLRADKIIELARERLSTIGMGFGVCIFTSLLIFPIWASDELHHVTSTKFDNLACCIEDCMKAYFSVISEKESMPKINVSGCKTVLNSKSSDESLANFARWEPWHGRFGLFYPWEKYIQIGELSRELASIILSMQECLGSPLQPSIPLQHAIKERCKSVGLSIGLTMRELGESIMSMKRCHAKVLTLPKLESNKLELIQVSTSPKLKGIAHVESLAIANFLFLLMEIVDKVEALAKEVETLGICKVVQSAPNTNVTSVLCNSGVYTKGDPFTISLAYILDELPKVTPSQKGTDCKTCLDAAEVHMLDTCNNRIGARATLNDCAIRYEQYPFSN
nr:aluminum-activated malate transporter 13-like [Tanacetum cinerariifolium]